MIRYFTAGFLTKFITGFDDSLTHIPIINYVTKTRAGKFAFAFGIFSAICLAIVFAVFFSYLLKLIPYYRYIVACLLFLLAIIIYQGGIPQKRTRKTEIKMTKIKKTKTKISGKRAIKLFLFGFIASFITVIDDTLAYSSILLREGLERIIVISGILSATILQIFLIIYFSKKLHNLSFKNELSAGALDTYFVCHGS